MWIWALVAAFAADGVCEKARVSDLRGIQAPAIVVLGERFGTQPDVARATAAVRTLSKRAKVTLALQDVPQKKQRVLDDYTDGKIYDEDLPTELEWNLEGWPWLPYARLLSLAGEDVEVLAVGVDDQPPSRTENIPLPAGYEELLADVLPEQPIAEGAGPEIARTMAWTDLRIARRALDSWGGEGFLVVLVDRTRVEGGKGVNWQISQRTDTKVHSYVLAYGENAPCLDGDKTF